MNLPRFAGVGVLIAAVALLAAGCGGVKNPEGWAGPAVEGSSSVYYFPAKNRLVGATLSQEGTQGTRTWQFPDKTKADQKDVGFSAVYGVALDAETDSLFFGSWDEEFYAVRTDGTLLWSIKTTGGLVGAPSLAGDHVAFGTTDGRLYVVNKSDGRPATGWPADGKSVARAVWAPTVASADGTTVYVGTMAGEVKAYDVATGNPKAGFTTFEVNGAIAELALLDDGHLFVPTLTKHVYIVNTATGEPVAPDGFITGDWVWTKPAFRDGIAYFGDFDGTVYALDISDGTTTRWSVDGKERIKAGPVIIGDVLIVGTREPSVLFINLKAGNEGQLLNTVPLSDAGTFRAPLTEENGYGLIATTNGKLYRADPKNYSVVQLTVAGEK